MASVHSVGGTITALESVTATDRQVLVRSQPAPAPASNRVTPELLRLAAQRRRGRPLVSLDALRAYPSVESLVAAAPIESSVDLPSITELLLLFEAGRLPDRATLSHLPSLQAAYFSHAQRDLEFRVDLLADLPMRSLAVHWLAMAPREVANLSSLTGLERLALDAGPHANVAVLAGLESLDYLALNSGRSGWKALSRLSNLTEAHLSEPSERSLEFVAGWSRLRTLGVYGPNVRSLAGLEHARELEWLRLAVLKAADLTPLSGLPALRYLELDELAEVQDLGPLADIESLEEVRLSGRLPTRWRVTSLEALAALPRLRVVVAHHVVTPAALRELRRRRPDVRIEGEWAATEAAAGFLEIHAPLEPGGEWWVLQDLSAALDTEGNAEAEALIRRIVSEADPELLDRLSFDSEAGAVGINAPTEGDLRRLQALLLRHLDRV